MLVVCGWALPYLISVLKYSDTSLLPGQQILQKKGRGRIIQDLSMQKMDDLHSEMKVAISLKKHRKSFTQVQMLTHGGTWSSCWNRSSVQSVFSRLHTQIVFHCSYLISHLLMLLCHLIHWGLSKWTNQMVENNASNRILWFQTPILQLNSMESHNKWHYLMASLKVLNKYSRSVDSMFVNCEQSVVLSAHGKWQLLHGRLLSKQDDFTNQLSMLETLIKEAGHECLFLPKFHCGLNPIEMVRN